MIDSAEIARGLAARGDAADTKVSAVVLAAGMSRRMGGEPKLLLDLGGVPMIRRTVQNVLAFAPVETIVVTGYRAAEIEAALAGLPVRFARNDAHEQGQPTSVAAGVRALRAHCNAVMVVLGDQPLVTAEHMRALVTAYAEMQDASILVPHVRGKRGNPVLFATRHIPAVLTGGVNIGCRRLIDTNSDDVARIEFESDVYTFDCDTPEDYRVLVGRLGAVA
ncbi:MAG: nucleotidyltransferase family protein [Bauldia sp.]